jgi:predicted glycoside hydrolase/deacetylase ChbG (UPF0249 family)
MRVLIVNADDFGQSSGVNAGVVRAHEEGVVTSATLMVRWPAAVEAADYARRTPTLSVGLHFDIGEWEYVADEWRELYEVVPADDQDAVAAELDRQLARFEELLGRPPTHLDSHQHVHSNPAVGRVLATAGRRLGVPVRNLSPGVAYCGDFYGQDGRGYPLSERIGVDAMIGIIGALPPGVTELGCHPAAADDVAGMYRGERLRELHTLCDPRVPVAIQANGVALRSFAVL